MQILLILWAEARARFPNQLKELKAEDLSKKLGDLPDSAGFLIRHLADMELLFLKMFWDKVK